MEKLLESAFRTLQEPQTLQPGVETDGKEEGFVMTSQMPNKPRRAAEALLQRVTGQGTCKRR
jgi:hypothetical protein